MKRINSNPNSNNKLALKCFEVFSAYSEQKQCVNGGVLTPKKASNAVSNWQICKCSFSTKIETDKLGRISTENQSQTSNREGIRATTLALMCASLSPLL